MQENKTTQGPSQTDLESPPNLSLSLRLGTGCVICPFRHHPPHQPSNRQLTFCLPLKQTVQGSESKHVSKQTTPTKKSTTFKTGTTTTPTKNGTPKGRRKKKGSGPLNSPPTGASAARPFSPATCWAHRARSALSAAKA